MKRKQGNQFLPDSSRRTIDLAVVQVQQNHLLIDEMLDLAFNEKNPIAQRASRVIFSFIEKENQFIDSLSEIIIKKLGVLENESVIGNLLSIYSECLLPKNEELVGLLADVCFKYLNQQTEREGIKICSMEILYKISNLYPEIKKELIINIETLMNHGKIAFQSRGQKILNKLANEMNTNIQYMEE